MLIRCDPGLPIHSPATNFTHALVSRFAALTSGPPVVIRTWYLRRLLVPLSYFIENVFQNWTRNTSDLLAYVYIYTDYTVPVEEMRQEFRRILESTPLWDQKVCVLQVSDATRTDHADRCLGRRAGFLESLGSTLLGAREINQVSTGEIPKQLAESPG